MTLTCKPSLSLEYPEFHPFTPCRWMFVCGVKASMCPKIRKVLEEDWRVGYLRWLFG